MEKYIVNPPCEIVHLQLGMPQNYKKKLIQESYRLKNRENRENASLFKDLFYEEEKNKVIGSSFKLWEESSLYDILLNNILTVVTELYKSPNEYEIVNTWVGIYNKGQQVALHSHEPSYKSFCYYISAQKPYTPMIFNDVGLEIESITDRLIIFPSYIRHSVPPCNGGERIMIAGNINIKPTK